MTPGARIATAIEILEKIEFARTPTEDMLSTYLRGRRYIGAKDRKYITQLVFGVQRRKARLDWITGIEKPRIRVIAYLFLLKESPKDELISLFPLAPGQS